jgi:mRNA interferase RelE/StbE
LRRQFDKKLRERLNAPRIPGDALRGYRDCYRIKLRNAGYRLIYRVDDERIVVLVLTIGQRERGEVYEDLAAIMADKHDRS